MDEKIVIFPNSDHERCSICEDDKVKVVIQGKTNCGYCGNAIALCKKHAIQMWMELYLTLQKG